jgi:hypothetical protein
LAQGFSGPTGQGVWSISFDPKIISLVWDPGRYFFTVFGKPSKDTTWGWPH